jgi:outer membrane protein assembly factor BamB
MSERARAIPLATLVSVVAVLAGLRIRDRATAKKPESASQDRRAVATADAGASASPLARSPEDAGSESDATADAAARMLHGDARHTDRSRAVGPTRAKLRWMSRIDAPVEAQVVVSPDEQTLYVASLDGSLSALDAATGAKVWRVLVGPLGERAYSTPTVAPNGTIYVGSDARRFYAVSPKGTVLWRLETNGEADTGGVLTGELVVFAAGASVFAVRAGGDVAWRFDAKRKVFTAPAVTSAGAIVVGSQDHHVYCLTPAGALAWTADLGADVDGAPAIDDDGSIVVGTDAGEVVRLSEAGDVISRAQVGGYVRGTLSVSRNGDALAGVYGPTPRVVRVAADGGVRASFPVQGTGGRELGVHGGPLEDATGALFFGAQDDFVHALGPGGAWEWSYATGGDVDAPLTLLSSGALVVASDDGTVYLFAP